MDRGARRVTPKPRWNPEYHARKTPLVAVESETSPEFSSPSPPSHSFRSMVNETSRSRLHSGFPQSTRANGSKRTLGAALGANGQRDNLQVHPSMLSPSGHQHLHLDPRVMDGAQRCRSKWPSAKKATDQRMGFPSQNHQQLSQESVLEPASDLSSVSSTPIRPGHTDTPSLCLQHAVHGRQHEAILQDKQSSPSRPWYENSSHPPHFHVMDAPLFNTAVSYYPPFGTEELDLFPSPTTSAQLLHLQQQPALFDEDLWDIESILPQVFLTLSEVQLLEELYALDELQMIHDLEMLLDDLQEVLARLQGMQVILKLMHEIWLLIQEIWLHLDRLEQVRLRGLKTADIIKLSSYRFDPSNCQSEQSQCVVCLCDFEKQQLLRVLPCKHVFHAECVDRWMRANSACPLCRTEVQQDSQ